MKTQTKESQAALTPEGVLGQLKDGNKRFVENRRLERDLVQQVQTTGSGQFPLAIVLGCVDSRVPPEMVFDQGIGDIFSVRIAGNFVNTDILGSMEFACKVAGAKLILVLGHSKCGAIMGACDNVQLGNLTDMLDNLKPSVEAVTSSGTSGSSADTTFVQKVAETNVELTIARIKKESLLLDEMSQSGEIIIAGAMYDVETGVVTFH